MTGFFRRHAALLIAVALVSGLAPSLTHGATGSNQVRAAGVGAAR